MGDGIDTLNVNCAPLFALLSDAVLFACDDKRATRLSRFVGIESVGSCRVCARLAIASARFQCEPFGNHVELPRSAFITLTEDFDGNAN